MHSRTLQSSFKCFFFFDYVFLSLFLLLCVQHLWSSPGSAPFPRIRSRITSSKWREIAPPATSELSVFCVCTCCLCASLLCKSSLYAIMHRERGEREMMSKTVLAMQEVGRGVGVGVANRKYICCTVLTSIRESRRVWWIHGCYT